MHSFVIRRWFARKRGPFVGAYRAYPWKPLPKTSATDASEAGK